MDAIRDDVLAALAGAGFDDVDVRLVLAPAWTTDWMSERGREQLREYGIAPPSRTTVGPYAAAHAVACPQCGSRHRGAGRFGSTACKSLWGCSACREPFDHFKAVLP